ncbi:MAG: hypothetical protein M1127_02770 [Patescibacteria group bacterium]|nr:hypothetical protein [Patescibacteria group bacterium]
MEQNYSPQGQSSISGVRPVWAIILIVLVVALIGVLVWQRNTTNEMADNLQQQITALQNQLSQKGNQQGGQVNQGNCVQEGAKITIDYIGQYGAIPGGVCCSGLVPIKDNESSKPLPEGGCSGLGSDAYMCTACGNGVCGLGENQCNCPQDCNVSAVTAKIISATLYNNKKDYQGISIEFSGAVDKTTITNDTVKICANSVSAGSGGSKSCSSIRDNNLDPANGVVLSFTGYTNKTVLIVEPKFGLGCAACSWTLEISGVRDTNGKFLQNMNFGLDQYITSFSG